MARPPALSVVPRFGVLARWGGRAIDRAQQESQTLLDAAQTELGKRPALAAAVSWDDRDDDAPGEVAMLVYARGPRAATRTAHELGPVQLAIIHDAMMRAWAAIAHADAVESHEARTLEPVDHVEALTIPSPRGPVSLLGELHAVEYDGTLQGEDARWRHAFRGPDRPRLVTDQDGRLYIVGGAYRVEDVGIVDQDEDADAPAPPRARRRRRAADEPELPGLPGL